MVAILSDPSNSADGIKSSLPLGETGAEGPRRVWRYRIPSVFRRP